MRTLPAPRSHRPDSFYLANPPAGRKRDLARIIRPPSRPAPVVTIRCPRSSPTLPPEHAMSHLDRRRFVQSAAALAAGAAALPELRAVEPIPVPPGRKFKLGTVTYNVANAWSLPTLLD